MMAGTATDANAAVLNARYGRTPHKKRRDRIILIIGAALVVVVFAAWVIWAGLDNGQGNLAAQDFAHSVVNNETVSITWQVSVSAGTPVSCALQAQNEAHAIVGWKIIDLPASATFNTMYTEVIRTSQRAVTGLIYRCWLT
ncbi:MAG: DUF4307 domain-containing protein [Terrimesophilobacter sp.]